MRWRRRADDHENPAWPGLTDLFAFSMVLVVLLWAQSNAASKGVDVAALKAENAQLKEELAKLRNGMDAALNERAHRKAVELRAALRAAIGEDEIQFGQVDPATHEFTIDRFRGKQLTFATGLATLSADDEQALRSALARVAPRLVAEQAAVLLLQGSADPRPLQSATHPRNNVELSALRAAEVAKCVKDGSADAAARTTVVGLGETGKLLPDTADPDAVYRPYRTVRLSVQIRKDRIPMD